MGRKKVFGGKLLNLYAGYKVMPDGRKAYFEEIEHPGAAIVVPWYRGKLLLVRQYRAVIGRRIWELPAGTLEKGESPSGCAKREVEEETGYRAGSVRRLGYLYTTPGFCNEKIHVYEAVCLRGGSASADDDEYLKVSVKSPAEVSKLMRSGKINDSKTIAALAMAGVV